MNCRKLHSLSFLAVLLVLCVTGTVHAQQTKKDTVKRKIIQFSGVVVNADSLKPIPFTSIIVKHTNRGTSSDYFGFFSFVAQTGDTIVFSNITYKNAEFIIPEDLDDNRYSLIQMLSPDTVTLNEAVVYPWPTREQFKEAFLFMHIPADDLERARKNLSPEYMAMRAEHLETDPNMAFRMTMFRHNSRLYAAGQLPPNNVLNPIAWAKFIEAWKRGDFKKDENKR